MSNQSYQGKHVVVLGFGVEGQPTVDWFLKQGSLVRVVEDKTREQFDQALLAQLEQRGVRFSFNTLPDLDVIDVVIRTPGAKVSHPLILAAQAKSIEVTTATNIFFEHCPGTIIGVTGTKGKGTTSTLISEMLKASGRSTYLGGNIGTPMLSFVDDIRADDTVVLELSSFQLIDAKKSPHIAVVLMVTSEHLDFHTDTAEYVAAKSGITRHQQPNDIVIVNRDYENSEHIASQSTGQTLAVSAKRVLEEDGCFIENEKIIARHKGIKTEILSTREVKLIGRHNLENICAAVAAALAAGAELPGIQTALQTFAGLPHRLEFVGEDAGISYYNDSFATIPESTIAAVQAFEQPLVLVLGGSGKGSDFAKLGQALARQNIRAIVGIGSEWPRIKKQLHLSNAIHIIEGASDMLAIIDAAQSVAMRGDVILLSPACASFDMFKNYKDRGDQFKKIVRERMQ